MSLPTIFEESEQLSDELMALIAVPLFDDSVRIRVSDTACSLSLEHWVSARALLSSGLLPSAFVVLRAQFEALARSIWLLYAALDTHLTKLDSELTLDSEQSAKNMAQLADMMLDLAKKAPPQPYDALVRFKENSWKALNSYAHAGIHPMRRHSQGYPPQLVHDILQNSNGLALISFMQAAVLSGQQQLQGAILSCAARYSKCMPLRL